MPSPRGYWLVGSDGGIFTLRLGPVLRVDRKPAPATARRRDRAHGGPRRLLARRLRRRRLRLRRHPVLRLASPGSGSIRPVRASPTASTRPLWAWSRPSTTTATSWWPPTAASSPSVTPTSPGPAPASAAARAAAVAVMPDASGNGYWLVTSTGNIYTFGDAPYFGAPGHGTVTSAVPTPDGLGYLVLLSNGQVFHYGDAAAAGSPAADQLQRLRSGHVHLQHVRRCGLLGLVGSRRRLQLRGRAQRRRDVRDPSERSPSSRPRGSDSRVTQPRKVGPCSSSRRA